MPLLLFSELVAVVLQVWSFRCSSEGEPSVSVSDISEEVKSFGDLVKMELFVEAREAFLDLAVGVRMAELVAEVCAPFPVHFGVVLLDSVPPKSLVGRDVSASEVSALESTLGDETGVAEVNRRAVRFVVREEAVDVRE